MIPGLSGSLLSHEALAEGIRIARDEAVAPAPVRRRLVAWHAAVTREIGPASGLRAVYDRVALPLMTELGFQVAMPDHPPGRALRAVLHAGGAPAAALLVLPWGEEPGAGWREGVRLGIAQGLHWCLCLNGRAVRVLDAQRTYARRFVEFDLAATLESDAAFHTFWRLLHAGAFTTGGRPALDAAVAESEAHRIAVRASLQLGVRDALGCLIDAFARGRRRRADSPQPLFDEALIVIYRVLFLLFAEARGLVPKWHPVYRVSYTIEALREPIERHARPDGLWESLQAIARLAHRGCHAGSLRVVPFNGGLFSPSGAPLAESLRLDDGRVREALLALTTRAERGERRRISYADLGVEQLGGVYERILDLEPSWGDARGPAVTLTPGGRRKAAGAFYTPRPLAEYLVRRTLAPLVRDASAEDILSLRVLDPAMGSGAFLVAACRYLAAAYEAALVRDGGPAAADLTEAERSGFRRRIAQRCLYGVDINPMAVQLGRLSLWLATLAADRPLTFLDHHLRTGNSLAGASLADLCSRSPSPRARRSAGRALPLFDGSAAGGAIGEAVGTLTFITTAPGDTVLQVREKERLLAALGGERAPLGRWKAAADLWCAGWLDAGLSAGGGASSRLFGALLDDVLERRGCLPDHVSGPRLARARETARRERFFHWTLEFPEVFYDAAGQPLAHAGFDAVIGNPPWEMLRGPRPGADASGLAAFARASGVYALQGDGHANLFQLFLERTLRLVREGGRYGLILPSGLASDHGCAALRRHLLDRTDLDTFVSLENRDGLFPIHRALRFLLLAGTAGGETAAVPCRSGVRAPDVLDRFPDAGADAGSVPISRALIARLSSAQAAIPDLRTAADVALVSKIAFSIPPLTEAAGWNVRFGRELNATDDRRHFVPLAGGRPRTSYPVIEGKQIAPFTVDVASARLGIPARTARRLLDPAESFARPRLAYRDVASAANRLTLIAAIVPARTVTTHTLFCLKGRPGRVEQEYLCAIFNSFVANYLVRLRVGMHVTTSILESLPVPIAGRDAPAFQALARLARLLARHPGDTAAAASLQACVARLYGLDEAEFRHVLASFPLVPAAIREAALSAFRASP